MPKISKKYYSAFIILGAASILGMFVPLFFKEAVDTVNAAQRTEFLLKILALYGAQYLISILGSILVLKMSEDYIKDLRNMISKSVLEAKVENFSNTNSGEYIAMISNHVTIIKDFFVTALPNFISSIITILGVLGFLFYLDYKLALVVFVILPLMVICVQPLSNLSRKYTDKYLNGQIMFSSKFSDVLGELQHVKVNNMEKSILHDLSLEVDHLKSTSVKSGMVNIFSTPLALMIIFMSISFVFYFGGSRVTDGSLTIGTLVSFLIYLLNLLNPFGALGGFFTELGKYKASSQRVKEVLQLQAEESEGETIDQIQSIKLEAVKFQYNNRNKKVLNGISMDIPKGKRVAMVGPSGSGKTTIINLLTKLYNNYEGQILINDLPHSVKFFV